jgi:hypothetical protein
VSEGSPFSPEQRQELDDAKARAASFMGAAKVASFNGWTFGFFAVISILTGLTSIPVLLVGVGLAVVARNELAGRKRILEYDPDAFELLWKNQVALMAIIVAYCLWAMTRARTPDASLQELTELLGEGFDELVQQLITVAYAAVIGATLIFQGLNARYYHVRIARLKGYLAETPEWVVDVQRAVP